MGRPGRTDGETGDFVRPGALRGTLRLHAGLWAEVSREGRVIGAHDLWLAAAALAHGLALATANVREFGHVPGLDVEDWSRA